MKTFYAVIFTFLTIGLSAQTAPDFTVTDTHGKTHSLYADYLDQGKTVVLDLFFVNCPPCNDLAPLLEPLYQKWGAGNADVEFFSLTSDAGDTDAIVIEFEERHKTTWPAASADGGGPAAQQPYTTGTFGQFIGYPTLIVVAPDGTVQFDAWGGTYAETVNIVDEWIQNTGATGLLSSVEEGIANVESFNVYPNPTTTESVIDVTVVETSDVTISVVNALGQIVKEVFNGQMTAGENSVTVSTFDLAAGVNWIKVEMNDQAHMEQLVKF